MFIVVIHIVEEAGKEVCARTLEQAKCAFDNGADGLFLIPAQGGMLPETVLGCYHCVRTAYSVAFIGINFLSPLAVAAAKIPACANALWTDTSLGLRDQSAVLQEAARVLQERSWGGEVFAGLMFKGNNSEFPSDAVLEGYVELMRGAGEAGERRLMQVAVTSGPGTGVAADEGFIRRVKGLADRMHLPLGVASGVSLDTIGSLLLDGEDPLCQHFIVGTGVERLAIDDATLAFYQEAGLPVSSAVQVGYLDADRVREMAAAIRGRA